MEGSGCSLLHRGEWRDLVNWLHMGYRGGWGGGRGGQNGLKEECSLCMVPNTSARAHVLLLLLTVPMDTGKTVVANVVRPGCYISLYCYFTP